MSLHGVVEDNIPGVELKSGLASEPLVGASHGWPRKASNGLFGNTPREGMAKMHLALAFAGTEPSVQ